MSISEQLYGQKRMCLFKSNRRSYSPRTGLSSSTSVKLHLTSTHPTSILASITTATRSFLHCAINHTFPTLYRHNGRILFRRRSVPLTPAAPATSNPPNTSLELLNIHNAFHQGQFADVLSFPTASLSPENKLAAQVLALRARIAQGDVDAVIDELEGDEQPELKAVKSFAEYTSGKTEEAVAAIEELVGSSADNAVVQVLGANVLHQAGKSEEAVQLLSKHQGNLEA